MFRGEEEQALESRYGHLFTPYGEGDVGGKILDRMLALSLPAYGNNLSAIEDMLDDAYHAELNAHYYFQKGRVLAEAYTLPSFDWETYRDLREWNGKKAIEMWEAHETEKRRFFLEVAETLWDFTAFAKKYRELLTEEEVETYHEYCKKIFIEERVFLQPEWLLFSCAQWRGKESFLYDNSCTEFFMQAHGDALALLPEYALKSKVLKEMLAKRYKIRYN